MATFNTYLNFPGNAEEAFNFYKSVFGGDFAVVQKFKDTPEAGQVPEAELDKIMHIALPISDKQVLMATDALESMGHKLVTGNNYHISVTPDSEEEAHKLFDGLSAGGKIEVTLQKMFWGALFGMFTDKFGVQWMINYDEAHR